MDEVQAARGLLVRRPVPGEAPDKCFRAWQKGKGVYATNGVVIAVIQESGEDVDAPDLIVFGIPAFFKGYYPGYSKELTKARNIFTWAILRRTRRTRAALCACAPPIRATRR